VSKANKPENKPSLIASVGLGSKEFGEENICGRESRETNPLINNFPLRTCEIENYKKIDSLRTS
jgi:hypothetical protein